MPKFSVRFSSGVLLVTLILFAGTAHAQLVFDQTAFDFGQIAVGNSSPTLQTNLINQGDAAVVVNCAGGATSTSQFGAAQSCQGLTLNPGDSCTFSYTFTPDGAGSFSDNSAPVCNGFPLSVDLTGEGVLPGLVFSQTALDFGEVVVSNTSPTQTVDLINQGAGPVTVNCAGGATSTSQFNASQSCQGLTLNTGDSCTFGYNFTPDATGSFADNSAPVCNGVTLSVDLAGEGVNTIANPALVFETTGLDFGQVAVGNASPTQSVALRNQGDAAVVVNCAGGATGTPQFSAFQSCQGVTLNPGESCNFGYTFTPAAPGTAVDNSAPVCNGNALSVDMTGEGVLPGLVFTTTSLDFGVVTVGATSGTLSVPLLNQGPGPVTVNCAGGAPATPQFNAFQSCQGLTLNPGESCNFGYTFSPDGPGSFSDNSAPVCNGVALSVDMAGVGEAASPGVTVTPTAGLITTEAGGTDSFDVVLESQPGADVTVDVLSDDESEGIAAPAALVFTAANWFQAQTVTVTGVDDPGVDGDQPYTVVTTVSSTDGAYDGIAADDVAVTNLDNDLSAPPSGGDDAVSVPALQIPGLILLLILMTALGLQYRRRMG